MILLSGIHSHYTMRYGLECIHILVKTLARTLWKIYLTGFWIVYFWCPHYLLRLCCTLQVRRKAIWPVVKREVERIVREPSSFFNLNFTSMQLQVGYGDWYIWAWFWSAVLSFRIWRSSVINSLVKLTMELIKTLMKLYWSDWRGLQNVGTRGVPLNTIATLVALNKYNNNAMEQLRTRQVIYEHVVKRHPWASCFVLFAHSVFLVSFSNLINRYTAWLQQVQKFSCSSRTSELVYMFVYSIISLCCCNI